MMDRLREGVNSIAVKIILGLIILSFVFAGVGSYIVGGNANTAAKVGSAEIGRGEFEQAYQNERNRMQSQLGDYFANLLADPSYVASFRKSVLDRMINDVLLEQHAASLGLRVSDSQIRTMILEMPQFQNEGAFDQEIYQSGLRRAGFSPESFAEYLRRDQIRTQLLTAIQGSDFALEGEVEAQSQLITQTRQIRKVSLSLGDFAKQVELSDEEIEQFYQQNSERYTRPEQVKVSYLELSAQELRDTIDVTVEQAKAYYEEHLDKYSSEEQRKISHILVQGDAEKAQSILAELKAGADFTALAKEKSEDFGSAEEGGSLGYIERDVMDPAFEDAAFALKKVGDISDVVQSSFGYHIIRLDEVNDSETQPFESVSSEITEELRDQQAVDRFYELQSELEKVAFEYPDSLDDSAQTIDQKIQTTEFVSQVDAPEVLRTPAVLQALLSPEVKEDGLNSEVIEIAPEHVIVVRVEDARDEVVLPLNEVKDQVVIQLSNVQGEQKALTLAETLVSELNKGNNAVLADNELEFSASESIDRSSPLADVVFSMVKPQEGQTVYGQAKDFTGDIVVVALDKVEATVEPQYMQQIGTQLTQLNAQQDLTGLLSIIRANTEIEYFIVSEDTQ